ncbi:MAG: C39 family peptidase [Candidatus Dormibacteria bacterium]
MTRLWVPRGPGPAQVMVTLVLALAPVMSAHAATPSPAVPSPATDNSGRLYILDGWGGVHPVGSAPPVGLSDYWPGTDLARSLTVLPGGGAPGGYVLDAFGGVHQFGSAAPVEQAAYWPGWDIARGLALTGPGRGYVLDGWGALHPFGGAPVDGTGAYWPGWDIARAVAVYPSGGGYVLDGWGGLHPFGGAPAARIDAYWAGWDIARGLALLPSGGGYVLDGFGSLHAFGGAPQLASGTYWPGWDIARGVTLWTGSGSPGGWVLDGYGGLHGFGGAPWPGNSDYWPGWDIARGLGGPAAGGGSHVDTRRVLSVPLVRESHGLTCEASALQMVLASEGIGVTQDQVLALSGVDLRPPVWDASGFHWGDPYQSFVGNPDGSEARLTGYGQYYPTIAYAAQRSGATVRTAAENVSPAELYTDVLNYHPAVVWVTFDWQYHAASTYTAFDGRAVPFDAPQEHAVALVGVDTAAGTVLIQDALAGGQSWMPRSVFEASYASLNDMAVVLE